MSSLTIGGRWRLPWEVWIFGSSCSSGDGHSHTGSGETVELHDDGD